MSSREYLTSIPLFCVLMGKQGSHWLKTMKKKSVNEASKVGKQGKLDHNNFRIFLPGS
jgi:hypothetical protein